MIIELSNTDLVNTFISLKYIDAGYWVWVKVDGRNKCLG